MKRFLRIVIQVIIIGSMIPLLLLAYKTTPMAFNKANTPEVVLGQYLDYRKNQEHENIEPIISPSYLGIHDKGSNQFILELQESDDNTFKEIVDYKITDVTEVNKKTFSAKVEIDYIDKSDKEKTINETYAILKEDGVWKVSPDGVLDATVYSHGTIIAKEGDFSIELKKRVRTTTGTKLLMKVINNGDVDVSLGGINPTEVILETSEGRIVESLKSTVCVKSGVEGYVSVDIPDFTGDIYKVTVEEILILDKNGNPSFDNVREWVIYKKESEK